MITTMMLTTLRIFFSILMSVTLVTGCGKQESQVEPMPEATDMTCTAENKNKYGQAFSDQCFLRGKFKPNSGRQW
jgi:entry exclusion lipoprotein TrbK